MLNKSLHHRRGDAPGGDLLCHKSTYGTFVKDVRKYLLVPRGRYLLQGNPCYARVCAATARVAGGEWKLSSILSSML